MELIENIFVLVYPKHWKHKHDDGKTTEMKLLTGVDRVIYGTHKARLNWEIYPNWAWGLRITVEAGSIPASYPAASDSNPGSTEIFSFYCSVGKQYWDWAHVVVMQGILQMQLAANAWAM